MPIENTVVFQDLFEIPLRNGLTKPKAVRGSGIRMVNMGELFANGRLIDTPMERVPTTNAEFEKNKLMPGDLLFARQSLVLSGAGKCSIFLKDEEDVVFESHLIRCRLNKEIADPYFYYSYFSSWQGRSVIESITEQVAVAGIRGSDLAKIEVACPPLQDQKAIAHVLGTLDNKIELNRKTNETLEGIAKALFKSWFVDFDPVRAKAEGRPTGLPDEISELFPDSFEESELGEIPLGWSAAQLGDCSLEIESGKRPKGGINKSLTSGVPSVGAESIDSAGLFDYGKTKYISEEFASTASKGWVRELDVALYKDGGKPGEFRPRVAIYGNSFPFSRFMVNEHVFLLRSEELGQIFLYHLFGFDLVREQIIHKGSSKGAQPGLNQQEVKSSLFVKPDQAILEIFSRQAEALTSKQFHVGKQNLLLKDLRDVLLPRLISGELRVPDAEKMLEEVGI